ncbi:MAG: patatin family protein [Oscillospiraceae bacterium]|nr:patatin family protein [Oscillospiraceae bacterium]
MSKTGLVLEGGGFRGIYTAGVLDVFMEEGLSFDGLIGVSAGAIHGCSFISGQKGRSIRYYRKYCGDPRFMSIRSWLTTGNVVGVDFCYHELPEVLDKFDDEAFMKNPSHYYVVCTNVETGKPEYIRLTDMRKEIDYLRASASLPYFSKIVEIDGKKYLDGGCTDSVPLEAFEDLGYGRNVVVLTEPEDYRKKPELRLLAKTVYRRYPDFARALVNRHESYNNMLDMLKEKERQGSIFIIRPSEHMEIGRMESDVNKVQAAYDLGVKDAKARLAALRDWLSKGENNG